MKRIFTLIELVVVIVILGIIAAILFPVLAQKNGKHPGISCLSHTKQLGMAMMMYSQDYNGHLPPAEKWMTLSMPYIKSKTVYVCPTVKKEAPKVQASYAMDTRLSGKSLNKLKDPSHQALAYDSTRTDWDATDPCQTFVPWHRWSEQYLGSLVFADGHAKQVSREQFAAASRAQVVDKQ